MENQNPIEEIREGLKYLWIHRNGNEVHAAVADTIEAKYLKLKPLIVKKIKLADNAFRFLINLPAGLGYAEFKKLEPLFADATGGSVDISKHGKTITMDVMTEELKASYPYSLFDAGQYGGMYLPFPVGMSAKGLIVRDLTEYPHFFLGGETNYGKSNGLHVIANSILLHRPETFVAIVDPKSTEFSYLDGRALVVDEMNKVGVLLMKLNQVMDERKKILKAAHCVKIQKYLEKSYEMPFIVLIIDEWADLPDDVQEHLWRLLRMGRFVGIHIVAATQRPSSKTFEKFGDMKAMFYGRMSFVVADELNSRMILDNDRAAHLPAIKGRAIYKCGLECLEVQMLYLDPEEAEKMLNSQNIAYKVVNHIELDESPKMLPPRQRFALSAGKGRGPKH
ncbi:FtsK/SpoIIIE domain-containing protein [Desulfitobacterium hafniense]|uniref:FtsK domain-containing protein n=1 Tax=Desulfitobacterium hafniense (strain Y51) TaxID=138119 RepID=Q24VI9_DESHY|nr:FtsK/SpoIIIE domain-containing protein [Desulfitobacterium hafniense]BAE83953.1 hypothetical protein DSY2164 [Desulfitobacterium hafniense Y51]